MNTPDLFAPQPHSEREIYSVTRLNREVRTLLERSFSLLWVEGEVSNLARPASGHMYFSVKDNDSQVRCAMFRGRNSTLNFDVQAGMQVLLRVRVGLYEGRGEYQLVVEYMEPAGEGALRLAFERLKNRLESEGLFAAEHKQLLPSLPTRVGLVTSPTGAAVRDVLSVLARRFPSLPVVIYPVPVQGEAAARAIAQALQRADERAECDVLIVTRGGGSLEDLWAFNDERVARAVFACTIPIVVGVGHETDFTIADFVADLRAPTPSASAELVSPDRAKLGETLGLLARRAENAMRTRMEYRLQSLDYLEKRLVHPGQRLREYARRLGELRNQMVLGIRLNHELQQRRCGQLAARVIGANPMTRIALWLGTTRELLLRLDQSVQRSQQALTLRFRELARALQAVSPLATLGRGYAIVSTGEKILRDATAVTPGARVAARLAKGELRCTVDEIVPNPDSNED